ncbi:MAG: oxidoreductase [Saprospiraceae bacterium]
MEITKGKKTALIFGASGLVGGYCLDYLLRHAAYQRVIAFVRKPLKKEHERLHQIVIDFDRLEEHAAQMRGDDLFLCLGTTMAKAGSREAFYKVDFKYSYKVARIAAEHGVNQLLLVSSVGADKDSLFFYSRVKGELEDAVKELPFWSTHIFQPSVLLGERNENRWGEELAGKIGKVIDNFTGGLLSKYRPVEAEVVAQAMVNAAQQISKGVHIYPSNYLQNLANQNALIPK